MKITKSKLRQIIREEVGKNVDEGALPDIASAAAGIAALEADKGKQKPKRPPKLQIELLCWGSQKTVRPKWACPTSTRCC